MSQRGQGPAPGEAPGQFPSPAPGKTPPEQLPGPVIGETPEQPLNPAPQEAPPEQLPGPVTRETPEQLPNPAPGKTPSEQLPRPVTVPARVHLRVSEHGDAALPTLYEEVGGQAAFDALVTAFYERVRRDALMWPMYPQDDLAGAIWRLSTFLAQFFGGPTTYSDARGHPRLRLRHKPFPIDREAREHWLAHMRDALDEVGANGTMTLSPMNRARMLDYFDRASTALINTPS